MSEIDHMEDTAVSPQRWGFAGLGAMGGPMARNLARAGLLAAVWNRTPAKAEALATELDCAAASSLAALAEQCDAVVICVSADDDLRSVVSALMPESANSTASLQLIVDCSTVSAATARELEAALAQRGVQFVDAPVSGGTEGAANGALSIMCGGADSAFAAAQPALHAMGARITHMGPAGSGQATKAVNQVLGAGIGQATAEALAFAEAQGLPIDKVVDVVSAGASGNWFVQHRGKTMVRGEYPLGFKVSLHDKDLKICKAMAADLPGGHALPIVDLTLARYDALMAAGFGDDDVSAVYRIVGSGD